MSNRLAPSTLLPRLALVVLVAALTACTASSPPPPEVGQACDGRMPSCAETAYCEPSDLWDCGGPGICLERPEACTQEFDPVCGCDGTTYPNACAAAAAGVSVAARGMCAESGFPVSGGAAGFDPYPEPGVEEPRRCGTPGLAPCADDEWCNVFDPRSCGGDGRGGVCRPRPIGCTKEYSPVCGCDGKTYGNACSAHLAGVDWSNVGPCTAP